MSGNVGSAICMSSVVENVGVAVRIAFPALPVQELLLCLVFTSYSLDFKPPFWICGRCQIWFESAVL